MQRLIVGAIFLLFITAAAASARVGDTITEPIAPKDIKVKDELAKKDPKKLTKKEKEKLERERLMKAESLKNDIEGI